MKSRLDFARISPQSLKPLLALGAHAETSGLEHPLLELVKMRASQSNGFAYFLDMHSKDARTQRETELNSWRETSLYTERERAARRRSPGMFKHLQKSA
jgi:AhpD family alkylhydroperoxidase